LETQSLDLREQVRAPTDPSRGKRKSKFNPFYSFSRTYHIQRNMHTKLWFVCTKYEISEMKILQREKEAYLRCHVREKTILHCATKFGMEDLWAEREQIRN